MLLQLVKAGLALGLFGGTHKFLDDKVVFAQYLHISVVMDDYITITSDVCSAGRS